MQLTALTIDLDTHLRLLGRLELWQRSAALSFLRQAVDSSLCASGYESSDQAAYLDGMLRWGLDWLIAVSPLTTCHS